MKAVVMAGGFGTRIQPLTHSRPKPMLPIMNKPMMEHTIVMLRDLGIQEFIVLLYFKPEIIQDYFKDGSEWGIKITYVLPDNDYGTAGAVKLAQKHIGNDNFIIISGDLVTDFDFQKLFDFHKKEKAKLSIGITSVENPLEFGVVIVNKEHKIEKFLEKPSWGEVFSDTINTGIYILEPEILNYIPENENYDFGKELFPFLMQRGVTLMGCTLDGYWRDVGNPESYREVYEDILSNKVKFNIMANKQNFPDGVLYSTEKYSIDPSVEIIGTVLLGKNVEIRKGVKLNNTVISDNVVLGHSAKIRNCVIWDNTEIGKNVILDNCVICNDNIIHKNVKAKSGLILAEGCEVGELASFEQDVIIWPDKTIEPASIVTRSLILGSKYKNSIFENGSVSGKSNIELSCEMATKLAEAFAAHMPIGARVIVGRDDDKSSRMLKRAFLGGLLSAGVNVLDIKNVPPSVLRYTLANDPSLMGGAHFKRCLVDTTSSEITLFNEDAMRVSTSSAKAIEKSFFTEKFRRVDFSQIGSVIESRHYMETSAYTKKIEEQISHGIIKCGGFKVAVDLMHGTTMHIFPSLLNNLGVENIILNAYYDEKKLSNVAALEKKSFSNISSIVKNLGFDMGLIIYPNAQKLSIVTEKGEILDKVEILYTVLELLDMEAKEKGVTKKVFLPTWSPDIKKYENLVLESGKYSTFKPEKLNEYDLIATVDGNFSFIEFGYTRDAIFASLKIMELLSCHRVKLSDLLERVGDFYYKMTKVTCKQSLKGKMMRKFLEDAKSYKSSSEDGVKIWKNDTDWLLMIPDQYTENLNLYVQAKDKKAGEALLEEYIKKIALWADE
ncbi:MAG: sugar phosphate nucleotidyltransferase [Sulfurimonadaceae bacterium]|jgi:mannose-1-phosphate guanylyltransferase/phosphomannomutase|nr:sugar phosphate nucleotidyltransferase [Sulfurimonadaceae bacterium]